MRVTINENEEVEVGDDTAENFMLDEPVAISDSVFKCSNCKTGTIHQGYEFAYCPVEAHDICPHKRVYLCTNCGKFSSK